jgi:tRNA pseudouridine38-40 synthase
MRYFIRISFDGTPFHGWQIQQNANSVQAELNRAIAVVLRRDEIVTTGCGRTDTGVHALKFYAHFDHDVELDSNAIAQKLNAILPREIAVHSFFSVDEDAHARFSALSRTYKYRIHTLKDPFLINRSYFIPFAPDLEKMNALAAVLLKKEDFSCFAKSNTQTNTNLCKMTFARWEIIGDEIVFKISADRFLRNMVRAVVGTLLLAGFDKLNEQEFEEILASGDRSEAGVSVPAHGLYLSDISYPFPVY